MHGVSAGFNADTLFSVPLKTFNGVSFRVTTPRGDRLRRICLSVCRPSLLQWSVLGTGLLSLVQHGDQLLLPGCSPNFLDSAKGRIFQIDFFSQNFPDRSHMFFHSNHLDVVHINGQEKLLKRFTSWYCILIWVEKYVFKSSSPQQSFLQQRQ